MTVNTLVTGLIVFKISKVFRGAKVRQFSGDTTSLGTTGGTRLRSIIFIVIESGAALFCIQLVRITVSILMTDVGVEVFDLVVGIHQMLNVIINTAIYFFSFFFFLNKIWIWQGLTPTIILVRVSMGLSFYDEKTMAEATSMHLHPQETESTAIIIGHRKMKDLDDKYTEDIEMSEKSVDGSLLL
jgi:hypothetical protein